MTASELKLRLAAYIAVRQSLGYGMRAEKTLLADLVRFLDERGELNPIRGQAAFDWATQPASHRGPGEMRHALRWHADSCFTCAPATPIRMCLRMAYSAQRAGGFPICLQTSRLISCWKRPSKPVHAARYGHTHWGCCLASLGLWPEPEKRWPCLTSFRHTFAIRRLRTWYEDGADLTTVLPHLSVYLGHVSPRETYWYLTATPELLTAAAQRFGQYAGGKQ